MNTDKITIYPIPAHTPEWYDFRRNGIGGSEAAIPMGLSKYGNPAKMFYEKLGLADPFIEDNEKLFWGRELEAQIATKWQYYDGTPTGYLKNFAEDKLIRKCRKINGYAVNSDYPWLFSSPDRVINRKGGFKLTTGEPLEEEQGLEIKTMEDFVSKQWESGIPVYHIVQVHEYMIVMEMDYYELVVLMNGRYFNVHPIDRNENLCREIISVTKRFWYEHVEPAQPYAREFLLAQARGDTKAMERAQAMIQKYEPEPTAGESYKEFLSQRFTKKQDIVKPPAYLWSVAKRHKDMNAISNYFADQKSLCANILAKFLSDNGADKIDFGTDKGFVHYQSRGGGVKFPDNRIKYKVDELQVIKTLSKLNIEF